MQTRLDGKRALVCGSSQGIGRAAAEALAGLGARVTLLARDAEALRGVVEGLPRGQEMADGAGAGTAFTPGLGGEPPRLERGATGEGGAPKHGRLEDSLAVAHDFVAADFADPEAVEHVVRERMGDGTVFHILINNTGGPPAGRAIDADAAAYEEAFRRHLVCNQLLAQLVVPGMRDAGYGRIVNVISTSVKQPIPGLGVSNTVRGAVASWAKTLSMELAADGITVNNVLPGFTKTGRLESLIQGRAAKRGVEPAVVERELLDSVPAGRFGDPAEVAAMIAFLASPAAGYVSGQSIAVDGGRTGAI